jgi:hypothetical protein
MTLNPAVSVLIVDRSHSWGSELRTRLASLGVHIHVVNSSAAALTFACTKKIDVAVLEFAVDGWTKDLCASLKACGVPFVYMAPQHLGSVSRARSGSGRIIELAGAESALN